MDQKKQTQKLPGFYIALCCCVAAVGIAGYFVQSTGRRASEATPQAAVADSFDSEPVNETLTVSDAEPIEPLLNPQTETPQAPLSVELAEDYSYAIDNPDLEASSVVVNAADAAIFTDPVPGMSVLEGFSDSSPVYNSFYCDWRTHNGIDIAAETGSSVSAACDGTISEISCGSYGNQVTIEHSNGFKTVYAQLGDINVAVGDAVTAGSVIGIIAESTGENVTKPHLHFEVLKDGKYVNPSEY